MSKKITISVLVCLTLLVITIGCAPTSLGEAGEATEATEIPETDLMARIEAPAVLASGETVTLSFTLTNKTDASLYVLKWYTPLEGIAGEIFRVERDGQAVPYQGILATRVAPSAEAYVRLEPGASASAEVNLATAYDFSPAGEYTIAFISPRISHVARSEAEMATSLDELGPVEIPTNKVTVEVRESAGSSDRKNLGEAKEMIRDYLCDQKPNLSPDVHLPLIKVPLEEGAETLPMQIFRVTDGPFARETFLINGEAVLRLGTAVGGQGVTSIRVSDLDQDGSAELLFTYSFGSGIHQTRIAMYAPAYAEDRLYEAGMAYLGDAGLIKEEMSRVAVRVVESEDENLVLRYGETLGYLAIETDEDDVQLVLQVAEELPGDVRQNLTLTTDQGRAGAYAG